MNKKIVAFVSVPTLALIIFILFNAGTKNDPFSIPVTADNNLKYEQVFIPPHPQISATNYTVINAENGDILAEHKGDQPRAPASLTKLMTVYVIENELASKQMELSDMVTISKKAWKMQGSKMFIEAGKRVSVKNLLKGVIIQSGNDAAVALAEHAAGSEETFVEMMNDTARRMGLKNSHFTNVTGLPHKDHYMSSNDLAILSKHIIQDHPKHYHLFGEKNFTYNNIKQGNRNSLLFKDKDVDGLKTGHTQEAGYCLAVSSTKENSRFVVILMGTKSEQKRTEDAQKLLSYSFRFYENDTLYPKMSLIEQKKFWHSKKPVDVGSSDSIAITIPNKTTDDVRFEFHYNPTLQAPIKKGQELGYMEIKWKDKTIKNVPLIALSATERSNTFMRGLANIRYIAYDYWKSS